MARSAFEIALEKLACDLSSPCGKLRRVPNQRHRGKVFLGGYVSKNLKRAFKRVAKQEAGGDARKMLLKLVVEGLKRRGIKINHEE